MARERVQAAAVAVGVEFDVAATPVQGVASQAHPVEGIHDGDRDG
jgi:hypothetical protein